MNETAARGLGCLGMVAALALLAWLLPTDMFAGIMALAIFLSIPMGFARWVLRDLFEDYGWWIWGAFWVVCLVFGPRLPRWMDEGAEGGDEA